MEYEQRFSMLVAEEDYYQRSERPMEAGNPSRTRGPVAGNCWPSGNDRARRLRSDYRLVRSDEGGWLPFRDVFEVDGRRLRDREDRMVRLLLHPSLSSRSGPAHHGGEHALQLRPHHQDDQHSRRSA